MVNPDDSNAMAEAIIRLKDDIEFKNKLVQNARAKVENFSWKAVKPKWESLLS